MNRLAFGALVLTIGFGAKAVDAAEKSDKNKPPEKKVAVNRQAPAFKIKDSEGNVIDLAKLTAKGPVLVRLTCGCSGCDKELAYFQALHKVYKGKGLTSLAMSSNVSAPMISIMAGPDQGSIPKIDSISSELSTNRPFGSTALVLSARSAKPSRSPCR